MSYKCEHLEEGSGIFSSDWCMVNKSRPEKVDYDTYKEYCKDNKERCPRYEDCSSSGSVCFLTTACVQERGLADDCHELETLRHFRDTYMKENDKQRMIDLYYTVAPDIVESINKRENAHEIYDEIYTEYIVPCCRLIEEDKMLETYTLYCKMVCELMYSYLAQPSSN